MGHPDFLPWFSWRNDLEEMGRRLRKNYQVYGQTALSLSHKAARFHIGLISGLPRDQVESMGLKPLTSFAEGLKWAGDFLPPDSVGLLIPRGGTILPLAVQQNRG